ncbi:metallophosphoesterase family protein [Rhizobium puerariae]|uniref:Metallophosphoesterase family protein n=1 Tax=Rhizobium puerariae TaxID=1585791 RepID=A0ABV6ALL7_9HYPH
MKIAILSDIHANREAFEAVLADCAARGAGRFIVLGDIVGYGPDPAWCVEKTVALAEAGATVIRGNHDQAINDPSPSMNSDAKAAIDWTTGVLSPAQKAFLAALPLSSAEEDRLCLHSEASAPSRFHYVRNAEGAARHFAHCEQRLSFCGHLHRPALYASGPGGKVTSFTPSRATPVPLLAQRRWLAVIGSVGQPRDGDPAAGYAILDTGTGELSFLKVPYDIETTAAKIRAAGLPDSLADRLFKGV